eukprot:SM000079S22475  [mRNA]  locus=s79:425313:426687:+ [translate_table: standard]
MPHTADGARSCDSGLIDGLDDLDSIAEPLTLHHLQTLQPELLEPATVYPTYPLRLRGSGGSRVSRTSSANSKPDGKPAKKRAKHGRDGGPWQSMNSCQQDPALLGTASIAAAHALLPFMMERGRRDQWGARTEDGNVLLHKMQRSGEEHQISSVQKVTDWLKEAEDPRPCHARAEEFRKPELDATSSAEVDAMAVTDSSPSGSNSSPLQASLVHSGSDHSSGSFFQRLVRLNPFHLLRQGGKRGAGLSQPSSERRDPASPTNFFALAQFWVSLGAWMRGPDWPAPRMLLVN